MFKIGSKKKREFSSNYRSQPFSNTETLLTKLKINILYIPYCAFLSNKVCGSGKRVACHCTLLQISRTLPQVENSCHAVFKPIIFN